MTQIRYWTNRYYKYVFGCLFLEIIAIWKVCRLFLFSVFLYFHFVRTNKNASDFRALDRLNGGGGLRHRVLVTKQNCRLGNVYDNGAESQYT